MDGSADGAATLAEPTASRASELARLLGVSADGARRLVEAGHDSPEAARALAPDELEQLGLSAPDLAALLHPTGAPSVAASPMNADQIVERWVGSVARTERARRPKLATSGTGSASVLRRWVDGDDRAMEEWIRQSEVAPAPPSAPAGPAPSAEAASPSGPAEPPAPAAVLEREETVVRWLTGLLDRVKSEQFDPASMIQEVQELQRQLYDERSRRKQLEDQVEHVKRGSIAVIKYVRSREAKEREAALQGQEEEIARLKQRLAAVDGSAGAPTAAAAPAAPPAPASPGPGTAELEQRLRDEFAAREQQYIARETELRRRVVHLEGEARRLGNEAEQARGQAAGPSSAGVDADVGRRLAEAAQRERELVARENELRTKFEEIRIARDDVERRRGPLEFKERELATYDQQLETRRQALDLEARRLEEARRSLGVGKVVAPSETDRLEQLRSELTKKEDELRSRETLLTERTRDLERLQSTAAVSEADRMHADSVADAQVARVRSGVRRLDDLLFGGYVAGTQLLLNGPAHSGKDVLARLFSVEGLRQGVPSIWVVTDKTYAQVRDDLAQLWSGYAEAERKGLVRFVDLYSLAVGATAPAAGVRLLSANDRGVLDQLSKTVDSYAEQLKDQFRTYRLVFESVSTVTAQLDTAATFRFLQPFVGRRKLDGAVGYYELESGMHAEADLETLEHMVDGSINLKLEQMKTFLAVRGLGEAQARSWIGYTFTKRAFNLGSFSLEHIR
jgi:KaiC/GvpD/RAD55 family RecA-like ATPase